MWQHSLTVTTRPRALTEITRDVADLIRQRGGGSGLCHMFLRHTSASLIITENADPAVLRDLSAFAERFAPENDPGYTHTAEGPDDMPAHLRSVFAGVELSVPVSDGRLLLGTWQGIHVWEHRRQSHQREVVVTVNLSRSQPTES